MIFLLLLIPLIILLIPVLLIAGLAFGLADDYIRNKIQTTLSQKLNVDVSLQKFQLLLTQQKVVVEGLIIGNPKGGNYTTPHMAQLNHADVTINFSKLLSKEVNLTDVNVSSTDFFFEGGITDSNIMTFVESLKPKDQKKKAEEPVENDRDLDFSDAVDAADEVAAGTGAGVVAGRELDDDEEEEKSSSSEQAPPQKSPVVAEKICVKQTGVTLTLTDLPDFVRNVSDGARIPIPEFNSSIGASRDGPANEEDFIAQFFTTVKEGAVAHIKNLIASASPAEAVEAVVDALPDVVENVDIDDAKKIGAKIGGKLASFF